MQPKYSLWIPLVISLVSEATILFAVHLWDLYPTFFINYSWYQYALWFATVSSLIIGFKLLLGKERKSYLILGFTLLGINSYLIFMFFWTAVYGDDMSRLTEEGENIYYSECQLPTGKAFNRYQSNEGAFFAKKMDSSSCF